jgi:hypothetical protein
MEALVWVLSAATALGDSAISCYLARCNLFLVWGYLFILFFTLLVPFPLCTQRQQREELV